MTRIYEEMEIYLKYQKKFMDISKHNGVKQIAKAEVKAVDTKQPAMVRCTSTKCNGT